MAKNTASRASRSGLSWLVDLAIEKWPLILAGIAGTAMTYLAAVTKWLSDYGPVAWGAIGIASFLIFAVGFWVAAKAQEIIVTTRFAKRREDTVEINPLDDHFSKRRIKLTDFFHPFYKPVRAVKFQDCELLGPATILPNGGSFLDSGFIGCEAIIVKMPLKTIGATAFENCTFERCKFFNVTFLLTKEMYLALKSIPGSEHFYAISDGTAGDI